MALWGSGVRIPSAPPDSISLPDNVEEVANGRAVALMRALVRFKFLPLQPRFTVVLVTDVPLPLLWPSRWYALRKFDQKSPRPRKFDQTSSCSLELDSKSATHSHGVPGQNTLGPR